jgi:hypothetical protein
MTNTALDAAGPGILAEETAGPLEQRHLQYANMRQPSRSDINA